MLPHSLNTPLSLRFYFVYIKLFASVHFKKLVRVGIMFEVNI